MRRCFVTKSHALALTTTALVWGIAGSAVAAGFGVQASTDALRWHGSRSVGAVNRCEPISSSGGIRSLVVALSSFETNHATTASRG